MAKEARKILYVGDDRSYWKELISRYSKTYNMTEFEFLNLIPKNDESFQNLFIKLFDIFPSILYIDISKYTKELLKLLRLVKNEYAFSDIPVVVLVDKSELINMGRYGGGDFVHMKCGEYHDVVYDPYLVKFPKEAKRPAFAVARLKKESLLTEDFRIGYIAPTSIRAEGDVRLEVGQIVELESAIPKKVIPSKKFVVKEISEHDLYFNYRYAYEFEFLFVDKPEMDSNPLDAELEKRKYEEKMAEYQQQLKKSKKANREWVLDNMDNTAPKKTKILILDKSISALRDVKNPISGSPYLIRCQTLLSEDLIEITRFRPSLFVMQYPDFELTATDRLLEPSEQQEKIEELKALQEQHTHRFEYLINFIKKMEGYDPFILIYNSKKINSKGFQERFQYPLILANADKLSIPNVIQLAEIYEKKQEAKYKIAIEHKIKELKAQDPPKYRNLKASDFEEKRYFIKKNHDLSFISINHDIEIVSLSESEIKFNTTADLELGSYRMDYPIKMCVSLIPQEGKKCLSQGGMNTYHGLINSTGENEKKHLRQLINDVFTKSVSEAEAKELEAFKELNKKMQRDTINQEAGAEQQATQKRIQDKIDKIKGIERTKSDEDDDAHESDAFGFKK